LANPNRDVPSRQRLVLDLAPDAEPWAAEYLASLVGFRWSHDDDLPDAVEVLGFDAALAMLAARGELASVEAELFEVDITLLNHRDLRTALGDTMAEAEDRGRLADQVFAAAISPDAMALFRRMVTHPRGRGIRYSLKVLGDLVANRRSRLVAVVTTAHELTQAQVDRLQAMLAAEYGHKMQLNIAVDATLMGGLRIRVGDDVIDGTTLARFIHLRRAITA
jgi:F-type H+-transporting ATPase subunit delta